MSSVQLYDTIGATYTVTRRTDPRIAAQIWAALGDARTVLNVGAGTGSYEPPDRHVLAVEPSALMRSQRLPGAAPCLAGSAEQLPFDDQTFDAAMAVCTVHHWQDPIAGLREMRRVARRVVVFLFDTSDPDQFWLTRDYLPEFADLRSCIVLASLTELAGAIDARPNRYPSRGTARTASSRPIGAGPRRTWTRASVAGCRSGRSRAGGRAESRAQPARRPRLRTVGRPQPRPHRARRSRARRSPADRLTPRIPRTALLSRRSPCAGVRSPGRPRRAGARPSLPSRDRRAWVSP